MSLKKKHRHIWFHESELRKKNQPTILCCMLLLVLVLPTVKLKASKKQSRSNLWGWRDWVCRQTPSWTAGNFCLVFTCIPGLRFLLPSQGRPCISYLHGNGFGVQALCSDHRLGKPGATVLLAAEKTIINRKSPKISQSTCCPRCVSASAELSMEGATLLAVIAYFQID